jgi:S1-C subfamily serine protease
MNVVDVLVLLLLTVAIVAGARAGFLGPVLGLLGAAGAFALALWLAGMLREPLTGIEQPTRALATLLGMAVLVLLGETLGAAAGARLSLGLRGSPFRALDAAGGAIVGAAHVVLLVWLLAAMIGMGLGPSIAAEARESVALRVIAERLPPPTLVAGRLLALLDTTDLPPLFGGLEPRPAAPVDGPTDAEAQALAASATASTAKIVATGCTAGLAVGSGFFVSATDAVTNAHVVAGSTSTTVTVGGMTYEAVVTVFDAGADLALLHVPDARVPALALASSAPGRGSTAVALGFPGGGSLTVTPAGVTAAHDVAGPNIYGEGASARSVIELSASVRPGNSGGPLVVEPGVVGGVIFGASRIDPDVGYAIGADEAVERIGPFIGATAAVGTGACL